MSTKIQSNPYPDEEDSEESEAEPVPALTEPLVEDPALSLPSGVSVSGAPMPGIPMKPEKKITLPRKKITVKIKREENPTAFMMSDSELAETVPGVTLSSVDAEPSEGTTVQADDSEK